MSKEPDQDEYFEVDLPDPPIYYSGSVEGTAEQQLDKLKKASFTGINKGMNDFIADVINKIVAKETGTLRASLIAEFRVAVLQGMRTFNITDATFGFEANIPDFPEYAEYHLDGTFGTMYKDPTTKGTRPTTIHELGESLEDYLYDGIVEALAAAGFDFT